MLRRYLDHIFEDCLRASQFFSQLRVTELDKGDMMVRMRADAHPVPHELEQALLA